MRHFHELVPTRTPTPTTCSAACRPKDGRRDSIIAELDGFAHDEDATWETGKCSGTMYCGDHEHYEFMDEAFELFAHVNALQRDMCPSMTKFEGEIIAMTLDLLHADAVTDGEPVGLVTSGGSGSILHAVLAYRECAQQNARHRPPELRQARDRAPRVRQGVPPARRRAAARADRPEDDDASTSTRWRSSIDENTIAIVGSACNYGYGTIDPIDELSDLALERGVGLHVDGCLGGFILPCGQELGYDIPRVRLPRPRRHDASRPTRTSTATASRARRCSCSATRRCATASTSS